MLKTMKIKFQKQQTISSKHYQEAISEFNEIGITKENLKKFPIILFKISMFIAGITLLYMFGWIYVLGIVMLIFSGLSILKLIF